MNIGDKVEWASQSGGFKTIKHGTIAAIVPANVSASSCIPAGYMVTKPGAMGDIYGRRRNHESYLVRVEGKGRRLYWPRVAHLRLSPVQPKPADTLTREQAAAMCRRVDGMQIGKLRIGRYASTAADPDARLLVYDPNNNGDGYDEQITFTPADLVEFCETVLRQVDHNPI